MSISSGGSGVVLRGALAALFLAAGALALTGCNGEPPAKVVAPAEPRPNLEGKLRAARKADQDRRSAKFTGLSETDSKPLPAAKVELPSKDTALAMVPPVKEPPLPPPPPKPEPEPEPKLTPEQAKRLKELATIDKYQAGLPKVMGLRKKKGICRIIKGNTGRLREATSIDAGWYYTWGPHPYAGGSPPRNMQFIPMLWGKWKGMRRTAVQAAIRGKEKGLYDMFLGFNEPDSDKQANMTVEEAIQAWPELMATGLKLGSPGCVHAAGGWMKNFMGEINKRKYRVDFIAVHWYGGINAGAFLSHLAHIHGLYGRPILVTEFAPALWGTNRHKLTPEIAARFMKAALPELEKRDYIMGYAWYSGGGGPCSLFTKDGLTELGKIYKRF